MQGKDSSTACPQHCFSTKRSGNTKRRFALLLAIVSLVHFCPSTECRSGTLRPHQHCHPRDAAEPCDQNYRELCTEAPVGATLGMDRPHRSARLHALKFYFIPLPHHLASSQQHLTTNYLSDYRRKIKCERVSIPFLTFSLSLSHRQPTQPPPRDSRTPFFYISFFSILITLLCFLCEYLYTHTLYPDIPSTATVRTMRVYYHNHVFLFVEEGMAL